MRRVSEVDLVPSQGVDQRRKKSGLVMREAESEMLDMLADTGEGRNSRRTCESRRREGYMNASEEVFGEEVAEGG
jgi:hypothetical protein